MRGGLLALGSAGIILGGIWVCQGIGILGGSFMTGQPRWAILGGVLLLAGLVICAYAARNRPAPPTR